MKTTEVLTRIDFMDHLYDILILDHLASRHIEEAKKDKEALKIAKLIIEERLNVNGSEEIYPK